MPSDRVFKSRAMQRVEAQIGQDLEAYLAEAYKTKTQATIAADLTELGARVDQSTVARWMRELGIAARFQGQRPPAATEAIA